MFESYQHQPFVPQARTIYAKDFIHIVYQRPFEEMPQGLPPYILQYIDHIGLNDINKKSVKFLDISRNKSLAIIPLLCKALQFNNTLLHLSLSGSNLSADTFHMLSKALQHNTTLSSIDFSKTIRGDVTHCLRHIRDIVRNTNITRVNLSYNDIGDACFIQFLREIKSVNQKFEMIEFRKCGLKNKSANHLISQSAHLPLQNIPLEKNHFSKDKVKSLLEQFNKYNIVTDIALSIHS